MSDCSCTRILVAALSAYVLGGLWYSPLLFLNAWTKASPNSNATIEAACHSTWTYIFALVMNVMTAAAMDHMMPKDTTMEDAVRQALMLAIFFVFSSFGTTYAFAGNKIMLLLVDSLYHVARISPS